MEREIIDMLMCFAQGNGQATLIYHFTMKTLFCHFANIGLQVEMMKSDIKPFFFFFVKNFHWIDIV